MQKHAVVIVLTLCTPASIGAVVEHFLRRVFPRTHWRCSLVIVGVDPSGGTADAVRNVIRTHPEVHILVAKDKESTGAAYLEALAYADRSLGADVLVEWDGDYHHQAGFFPNILLAVERGADLVLGVRSLPNGEHAKRGGLLRLSMKRMGASLLRLLLFFPFPEFRAITDPTTELRAFRVDGPFRKLDFSAFGIRGSACKVEMLYRLARLSSRIEEFPLRFPSRPFAAASTVLPSPLELGLASIKLRLSEEGTRRFLRFCVVGLSGFFVNAILLELLVGARFVSSLAGVFSFLSSRAALAFVARPAAWAAALSVEGAIINNFIWNNIWTFRAWRNQTSAPTVRRFLSFNLLSIGSVVIQFCTIGLATLLLGNSALVRQVTLVLTIGLVVLPYNWIAYNRIVWKEPKGH